MAEFIKRQAVFDALPIVKEDKQISLYGAVSDFMIIVSTIPTADVAEVKHGAWVVTRYHLYLNVYEEFLCCSVCGYEHQHDEWFEYCPNCGAKMDGKGGAQ